MDHRPCLAGLGKPRGRRCILTIPQGSSWSLPRRGRRAAGGGQPAAGGGQRAAAAAALALRACLLGSRLYFLCGISHGPRHKQKSPDQVSVDHPSHGYGKGRGEMEPRVPWVTTCRLLAHIGGSLYTQSRPALYKRHKDGSEGQPRGSQPQEEQGPHLPAQPQRPRPRGTVQSSDPNDVSPEPRRLQDVRVERGSFWVLGGLHK